MPTARPELHHLDAPQRVALFLASLAARPLAEDFDDPDAEVVRIGRRALHALAIDAGVGLGLHAFNAALSALDGFGVEAGGPRAVRVVSHARSHWVDVALFDLDDATDAAWEGLLDDVEALGDEDEDTRDSLQRLAFDVSTDLPSVFLSTSSARDSAPPSLTCPACNEVRPSSAFGVVGDRLKSRCRHCESLYLREWRATHPDATRRHARRQAFNYEPKMPKGLRLAP